MDNPYSDHEVDDKITSHCPSCKNPTRLQVIYADGGVYINCECVICGYWDTNWYPPLLLDNIVKHYQDPIRYNGPKDLTPIGMEYVANGRAI